MRDLWHEERLGWVARKTDNPCAYSFSFGKDISAAILWLYDFDEFLPERKFIASRARLETYRKLI